MFSIPGKYLYHTKLFSFYFWLKPILYYYKYFPKDFFFIFIFIYLFFFFTLKAFRLLAVSTNFLYPFRSSKSSSFLDSSVTLMSFTFLSHFLWVFLLLATRSRPTQAFWHNIFLILDLLYNFSKHTFFLLSYFLVTGFLVDL